MKGVKGVMKSPISMKKAMSAPSKAKKMPTLATIKARIPKGGLLSPKLRGGKSVGKGIR